MTGPAHRPNRRPTREERSFFEDLVALRAWYASRSSDDGIAVATMRHVIAAANAEMRRPASTPRAAFSGFDAN
jgi:hypothetical protein